MKTLLMSAAMLAAISVPAQAEVKSTTDSGFSVVHIADVSAQPDIIWKRLIAPKDWWNKAHSWSGTTTGFYIDAQAGGCFCELFQETTPDGKIKTTGSVEHMRVIFAQPGKVLRMQGALGPLQSEAMLGTLTVAMEPLKDGKGTRISLAYNVGGYMRYKVADIAPAVDKVLADQFKRLIEPYAPKVGQEPKADGFSLDVEKLEDPVAVDETAPAGEQAEAAAEENPESAAKQKSTSGTELR